jgi:hypothetical protein
MKCKENHPASFEERSNEDTLIIQPSNLIDREADITGFILSAENEEGKVKWMDPTALVAGSHQQIQFNEDGYLSAHASLTFDTTNHILCCSALASSVLSSPTELNLLCEDDLSLYSESNINIHPKYNLYLNGATHTNSLLIQDSNTIIDIHDCECKKEYHLGSQLLQHQNEYRYCLIDPSSDSIERGHWVTSCIKNNFTSNLTKLNSNFITCINHAKHTIQIDDERYLDGTVFIPSHAKVYTILSCTESTPGGSITFLIDALDQTISVGDRITICSSPYVVELASNDSSNHTQHSIGSVCEGGSSHTFRWIQTKGTTVLYSNTEGTIYPGDRLCIAMGNSKGRVQSSNNHHSIGKAITGTCEPNEYFVALL